MIGNSRVKKMTSRDGLLQELLAQATDDITGVSKGDQYSTLLKALIVQSMIKIEEDKITVICREQDVAAVKSVIQVHDCVCERVYCAFRITRNVATSWVLRCFRIDFSFDWGCFGSSYSLVSIRMITVVLV